MKSLILIILVITPGVWSGNWGVTFKNHCALKGTSVVINCKYDYPAFHIVRSVDWYKAQYSNSMWKLVALSNLPSTRDHFKYVGNKWSDCSLQINNVQRTDEGAYFFHFETNHDQWTSKTYAYLVVKELTTVVEPSIVTEGGNVRLACVADCHLTPVNIVWFRDEQPVRNTVFQARREDAGSYHCAMLGRETVRSKSVALNVQYAPEKVKLSMSPSGEVVKEGSVTFNCSSDANPPVTQSGYSLYKDGHFISSGQKHTISDIQPGHSGLYYCQAWNNISRRGIDFINSTEIHLNVQYYPVNISISMNPLHVVGGSSMNLTCSSAANPPANYTWYKRTDSLSSTVQVGSGQVLSIPSAEGSHTGLYLCQATNQLGKNNSTELLLDMMEGWKEEHGIQFLPIIAGIGVFLFVALVLALVLFWRKRRAHAERKQSHIGLSGRGSSSSGAEDQPNTVYANIHALPSSPPAVTDISPHSQKSSHPEYDAPTAHEDEVTYSTVTITPKKPSRSHHINNSRALQDSQSKLGENEEFVIYATVAKSS